MLARLSHKDLPRECHCNPLVDECHTLVRPEVPANLVWHALTEASYKVGVRLINAHQVSRTTWSFRLGLSDLDIHFVQYERWIKDRRKDPENDRRAVLCTAPRYARMNPRLTRRVSAVCWHGHADFMLHFFNLLPQAHIISRLDHWKGQDDFNARYRDSGYKNIGSQMEPCSYNEACICD